jgi:hypothetical protein
MNLNRRDAVSTLAEALQSLARWAFHRKIGQQIRVREYQEREYFSLGAQLRIGGAPLGSSSPTPAPVADARTSTWGRGHWYGKRSVKYGKPNPNVAVGELNRNRNLTRDPKQNRA